MREMYLGVLGCGNISDNYIVNTQRLYPQLKVLAVSDICQETAREKAEQHRIPHVYTLEEMLADERIEIVLNLTPAALHKELNEKILRAGKHLFSEKPLALTVEDAEYLCGLAEERQLFIGVAPDTFMSSGIKTCCKLIREGWIGKPLYVVANAMSFGVELWHPNPEAFYRAGSGPLYEIAPYYFTALVQMFGAIESVYAISAVGFTEKELYLPPRRGEKLAVEIPTYYSGVAKMKNGVSVNMNFSYDIWKSTLPLLEVYGTDGTLTMPDPNTSGGNAYIYRKEQRISEFFGGRSDDTEESFKLPELYPNIGMRVRGPGIMDLAQAIITKRPNSANGKLATHVLEAITGMMKSAESGERYLLKTSYEPSWED